MKITEVKHPLIAHKLALLRAEATYTSLFRSLIDEIVPLLAFSSTEKLRTVPVEVQTPLAKTTCYTLDKSPRPLVVPILRAGLGMLDGFMSLIPNANVGFLGMIRDDKTLIPSTYCDRLPEDVTGRQCFLLDPMLATGGSLKDAINYLVERGCTDITTVHLLAAPEGLKLLEDEYKKHPQVSIDVYTASIDERLNENGFIMPGLGDAGDRLYGMVD